MNADAFRQFYDYHFNANRTIWNLYITALTDEQFQQMRAIRAGRFAIRLSTSRVWTIHGFGN